MKTLILALLFSNFVHCQKASPPKEYGKPVEVKIHVTINNIGDVDVRSKTVDVKFFLALAWEDKGINLGHLTSPYRKLSSKERRSIWTPEVFMPNARKVSSYSVPNSNDYVAIFPNGYSLLKMINMEAKLLCPMHFQKFPFDTQVCNLQFESMHLTDNDMDLVWDSNIPFKLDPAIELSQYEVMEVNTTYSDKTYSTGTFSGVKAEITLKNRPWFFVWQYYLPTFLLTLMASLTHFISSEKVTRRLTFQIGTLFILVFFQLQFSLFEPATHYLTHLGWYRLVCYGIVFISIWETFAVAICQHNCCGRGGGVSKEDKDPRNGFENTRTTFSKSSRTASCIRIMDGVFGFGLPVALMALIVAITMF